MDSLDEHLDREYDARAAVPEVGAILERWAQRSRAVRCDEPCFLDVPYGTAPAERIDLFPARGRSRALLVFVHGGYWRSRDKAEFSFLAPAFTREGVSLAVVGYSLCPAVSVEHIVRQMRAAHAWLWRHAGRYGADASNLHVSGHSAGGHLAAMMAACDWPRHESGLPTGLVKGVLALSGLYDLTPLLRTRINADLRLDENAARLLSPVAREPAHAVPVFTAVGADETAEFHRQARLLAQRWPRCVVGAVPAPGCNHFTILDALADPASRLFRAALDMMLPGGRGG